MNITYLIGNGFDIGLGLKTDYRSFLDWYLKQPSESAEVEWLKSQVLKDQKQWSDAELAFGNLKFSSCKAGAKPLNVYDKCFDSITDAFSKYLSVENERLQIPTEKQEEVAEHFLQCILQLWRYMSDECKNAYLEHLKQSPLSLTFVTFNYTDSLEKMLGMPQNKPKEFNIEVEREKSVKVVVQAVLHAHGTLEADYVFGVDDENQIAEPDVRAYCVRNGGIIKARLEQKIGLRNRTHALDAINRASMLVTYGLSFGATDRSWWSALHNSFNGRNVPLIVCPYIKDFPERGYSITYRAKVYEQEKKRVFATLFDQNSSLREAIEKIDAPRITVLHPQKVKDGIGKVSPCDFFKLRYFYQKFVKKENF